MSKSDSYRRIAPFYSKLSSLGTWDGISRLRSQVDWSFISGRHVLVVGVGTGDLLPYLLEEDPSKITCVDSSQAMLDLVRTEAGAKRVELILDTYPITDQTETYDVIIFDFIVDSLTENEMNEWFTHAKHLSKPGGHVVVLDFNPRRQRSLYTKTVMAFFRQVTDYQRKQLADWCQILDQDTELNEVQSVSSLNKILIAKTWMIC